MRAGGFLHLLVSSSFLVACASGAAPAEEAQASASAVAPPPEPPPEPAGPEPVETGQACATATKECGGGSCTIKLKNDCEAPLTCDAFALLRCRTPTELVEAKGRERKTFPAKTTDDLIVTASCTEGDPVQTELTDLKCK
ncbi:MAG: hypothetical protein JNL21_19830 [Myxococcales bacterium]|nr:hypothetical protein [Myxococcales bacterium]